MTISQWDQVPEFAGEAEEASFWEDAKLDVRLMESSILAEKRERVRHNHVEDGPSNVVSGKIFGAFTFSELSKYDQAMVE